MDPVSGEGSGAQFWKAMERPALQVPMSIAVAAMPAASHATPLKQGTCSIKYYVYDVAISNPPEIASGP